LLFLLHFHQHVVYWPHVCVDGVSFLFYFFAETMPAVSGIVFGAAIAVYILSQHDSRVKKVYALAAAVVAALAALADFTSTQIPVAEICTTNSTAGTQTCVTEYTNDPTPLIFFVLSIILIILTLIEMSLEGVASALWP